VPDYPPALSAQAQDFARQQRTLIAGHKDLPRPSTRTSPRNCPVGLGDLSSDDYEAKLTEHSRLLINARKRNGRRRKEGRSIGVLQLRIS
jgi:hypothetical protein